MDFASRHQEVEHEHGILIPLKIPKIIHQTWKYKTMIPAKFTRWSSHCKDLHPESKGIYNLEAFDPDSGWIHRFTDDVDNLKFVEEVFPWFLEKYKALPFPISKVDAFRYMTLYVYGGFFMDLDFDCLGSLDPYLENRLLMASMGYPEKTFTDHSLPNSFLGSAPRHPFWLFLLQKLKSEEYSGSEVVEEVAGSRFLYKCFEEWETLRGRNSLLIDFIDPELVYPYDWRILGKKAKLCSAVKDTFDPEGCKAILGKNRLLVTYYSKIWGDDKMEAKMSEQTEEELERLKQALWATLKQGMMEIYNGNSSNLSFEELYRNAYNMVNQKDGEKLYHNTKKLIQTQLVKVVDTLIAPAFPSAPNASTYEIENFLKIFQKSWKDHILVMSMVKDVLMYLDRTFLKQRNLPLVYDSGIVLFRDTTVLCKAHEVQRNLVKSLIAYLNTSRDGDLIDKRLVKDIISILLIIPASGNNLSLSLYDTLFESEFLNSSRDYLRQLAREKIDILDVSTYLNLIDERFSKEELLVAELLDMKTAIKLRSIAENELVSVHVDQLIMNPVSGLLSMINNNKLEDLKLLYKITACAPNGHAALCLSISNHILSLGKMNSINETTKRDNQENKAFVLWLDQILKIKKNFDFLLSSCFSNSLAFEAAINSSLQSVVKLQPHDAEYISLYLDYYLKQIAKGKIALPEFESFLENAISVFRFLIEKDVFERFYKTNLAKRLLNIKSTSEDAERSVLSKLKMECGYQFTSKLEGMFNDTRLSIEMSPDFTLYLKAIENENPQFITGPYPGLFVNVLTSTFWPFSAPESQCVIPEFLNSLLGRFESFYTGRHSGRKLTWMKNMGSADVIAEFADGKKKELNLGIYPMVILLMCFNSIGNEAISFSKILEITGIPIDDAKRALQSLSLAKYKILVKISGAKGKDILTTDEYNVNLDFTCPHTKIKIMTISSNSNCQSTTTEELKEREITREKISEDRKFQIESAIVRIMKSRKTLGHNNLVSEVVDILSSRFQPDILMIKKRIEGLIDRDYLERDPDNRLNYHYVA